MLFNAQAFLALWNDISPTRSDYDVWHSKEHVPERLTVPGMTKAMRYANGRGELPPYFTLYALEHIAVLDSAAYIQLLNGPTPWSLSMRPDFTRFLRLPCHVEKSVGGGLGGWCVTALMRTCPSEPILSEVTQGLASLAPVTAVHIGSVLSQAAAVPFDVATDISTQPAAIAVIEGFCDLALTDAVTDFFDTNATDLGIESLTTYHLAYALDSNVISHVLPVTQDYISRACPHC